MSFDGTLLEINFYSKTREGEIQSQIKDEGISSLTAIKGFLWFFLPDQVLRSLPHNWDAERRCFHFIINLWIYFVVQLSLNIVISLKVSKMLKIPLSFSPVFILIFVCQSDIGSRINRFNGTRQLFAFVCRIGTWIINDLLTFRTLQEVISYHRPSAI